MTNVTNQGKIKAVDFDVTTTRNFYASKLNSKGEEIPYAFETVNERNQWLSRREDSKPISALEVYRKMKKSQFETLAANRNHRVIKTKHDDIIDINKGQRVLLK